MHRKQDEERARQRFLFLRYFEEFEASGLDPVSVMNLAFSVNSGIFLRRMVAGMELFRDRGRSPCEFFWGLENASPKTRDQIFNLLNWIDPAGLAAELDGIAVRERADAVRLRHARKIQLDNRVDELVPALRATLAKFEADGEVPSLFGIPGETIAAVLRAYVEKRRHHTRRSKPARGPVAFREIAVAILIKHGRSDENAKDVLRALNTARKEKQRGRRKL